MSKCEFAYHERGQSALRCLLLRQMYPSNNYCPHQYICPRTRKAEVSREGERCKVRAEHMNAGGE